MRIGPLGLPELLIILLVVLLIFGPRRLPDMAKGLGQSVREFRRGLKDMKEDFESEVNTDDKPRPQNKAAEAAAAAPAPATAAPSQATTAAQETTQQAPQETASAAPAPAPDDRETEVKEA
jgi:sec-independent protein translocase protein TatA